MLQDRLANGEPRPDAGINLATFEPPATTRQAGLFSMLISLALLVAVALALRDVRLADVVSLIPRSPWFWLVYAVNYVFSTATEWLIYRRLWGIPVSGLAALMRKMVSNELLLSYLGEVQFYAWARGRLNMVTAPFGAIKDVAILSALTGNIATLLLLAIAWPAVMSGRLGVQAHSAFLLLGVVLLTSFAILLFRQKLFTLPRHELGVITGIHFLRIFMNMGLTALMWHMVLPSVGFMLWLVLATLRMLISRLPLIPNKEIAFAGVAVFVLGHDLEVQGLTAMMTALLLATHIGVGAIFATSDLLFSRKEA